MGGSVERDATTVGSYLKRATYARQKVTKSRLAPTKAQRLQDHSWNAESGLRMIVSTAGKGGKHTAVKGNVTSGTMMGTQRDAQWLGMHR